VDPDAGAPVAVEPPSDAPLDTEETSKPYDCEAGYSNWEAGWSEDKKAWCCDNEQKACPETSRPYDCEAGYSNWEAGWSEDKQAWCCDNEQRACSGTTSSPASDDLDPVVDPDTGDAEVPSAGAKPLGDDSYCPPEGEDCSSTRCCAQPGFQCFTKNKKWASCLTNCTKGMLLPGDPKPTPWDCKELGAKTPLVGQVEGETVEGEVEVVVHEGWTTCSPRGEDCRASSCCAGKDDNCYMKNAQYGSCMPECDKTAKDTRGWLCTKLY